MLAWRRFGFNLFSKIDLVMMPALRQFGLLIAEGKRPRKGCGIVALMIINGWRWSLRSKATKFREAERKRRKTEFMFRRNG